MECKWDRRRVDNIYWWHSQCGQSLYHYDIGVVLDFNYCPYCGYPIKEGEILESID